MVHSQELTVDSLSDNEENDLLKDKERGLPDWMRDPTEVAAQQEQLATELRSLKAEYRNSAVNEWEKKYKPEHIWREVDAPPTKGRVICFDLETTGFSNEDSIIEIGAVELIDGYRTGILFQSYAKARGPIHPMAQAAHQISTEMLQSAPPIDFCISSFLEWVGTSPLVSHNTSFDMRMLSQELQRLELDQAFRGHIAFCTLKYWRKLYPQRAGTLDDMSAIFGVHKVRTAGYLSEVLASTKNRVVFQIVWLSFFTHLIANLFKNVQVVRRNIHGALVDAEILANCFMRLARVQ